ncbi:aminotransferase class III-fold pyridoxal phosphate-dependent enzyme [Candidatus Micrarchaeota archaeon]|nr:aminotransferase class III-fold pyridoxal phosphate-dependent enzyme [Candidatus Micrarchaeota archaeon]
MIKIQTAVPGPKSLRILKKLEQKNGAWSVAYPLVFSGRGEGAYCEDIDGNCFLDFSSQIASNPMGYNHPELIEVLKSYARFPIKYAGQDFTVKEHLDLIEEILSVSPKGMNSAFLINSGAEAVENAIKICMRKRPKAKFGISMKRAFHGRTLGALSLTNSSRVQKKGYMRFPMYRLSYDETAGDQLEDIIKREGDAEEIAFLVMEHVQGEGGYYIAPAKMVDLLRKTTKKYGIPYIADEIQSGMGRTGKWWAFENYGIRPDVFSSAKALQVGAVVSAKSMFPDEVGAISSTWGGGALLDMAISIKTIQIIKKQKLLERNRKFGNLLLKGLEDLDVKNQRGIGLMLAFDLDSVKERDNLVIECAKRGLIVLGCAQKSVRLVPPYVVTVEDAQKALEIIDDSLRTIRRKGFRLSGKICRFTNCGKHVI